MDNEIKSLVETTLQAKIVQAFHDAPEAIDLLVKAALETEVGEHGGKPSGYNDKKMPYLEWLVGQTIRNVAREVVIKAVEERQPQIEESIRAAITTDKMVEGIAAKILGNFDRGYNIVVDFRDDERR